MGFFSGVRAQEASARRHQWAQKRGPRPFRVPTHLPAADVDEELRGLQRSSAPRASGGVLAACARCHSPIADAHPGDVVFCAYCDLIRRGGAPLGQSYLRRG